MIDVIKENVSMYTLFDLTNPPVEYLTSDKECQIRCPFHGADKGPSARVYPETNSLYCWTCSRSWDVIDYWAEINGWYNKNGTSDVSRAVKDLISRFDLGNKRLDWKKDFYKYLGRVKNKERGYSGYSSDSREQYRDLYSWELIKHLSRLSKEDREAKAQKILSLWESLDMVDLSSDSWKSELSAWSASTRDLKPST